MTRWLPAIFALLVGAAGWFYLFYSRGVERLAAIEAPADNRRRGQLRRASAIAMLLLSATFFATVYSFHDDARAFTLGESIAFVAVSACVVILLLAIVVLAMADLRLTRKLNARRRDSSDPK